MPITLAAAAKLCGVDKSTLRRAVRSGRISGVRDEFGVWQVEVCEVERCFTIAPSAPEQPQGAPAALPRDAVGNAVADALVAELRAVIADLRSDRDHWRTQAQQLALTAQTRPASVPAVAQRRRWWRLAG